MQHCNMIHFNSGNIDMVHIHWSEEYGLEYTSSVVLSSTDIKFCIEIPMHSLLLVTYATK